MQKKILFIFIIILTFSTCTSAAPIRGLWVTRFALKDYNEISNIISTAKSLCITDLYVQVRALGQMYGQNGTDPEDSPFGLLVKSAQNEKIRVHAWINVLYIWAGNSPPQDDHHIYYKALNSLVRSSFLVQIPNYKMLKKQGIEGFFIDPGDQQNLLDIKFLISDLIQKYRVDGIHLDYLRYPSFDYSFSPNGRTKFFREYWFDPVDMFKFENDTLSSEILEKYKYASGTYKSFLRQQVTDLLIDLKEYIQQFNKRIELSVAVKPDREIAYNYYFQDWGDWLTNNICDRVVMMNYDTVTTNFINNLKTDLDEKYQEKIVVGISTYNQDFKAVQDRINITMNMGTAGYAIFSYNYLWEHQSYLRRLKSNLVRRK